MLNATIWGAKIVRAYTYFFTGTPLLIQLYLFYKGMPEFGWVQDLMQKRAGRFERRLLLGMAGVYIEHGCVQHRDFLRCDSQYTLMAISRQARPMA